MSETIFTVIAATFFCVGALLTIVFLVMMLIEEFKK
jgi:hypothetical protein